jgi:beta-galactosidase
MVEYWHWHSIHYGQETYWKGILSHDLQPNRALREMAVTAGELKRIGSKLVNLKKENSIAILFSHDANDALNFMPFDQVGNPRETVNNDYYRNELVGQFHRILYQLNAGVDFIFPEDSNFEKYKLIIVPSLYIASDELLQKIADYVKGGGHAIIQFKSGFCDENSMVRPVIAPGQIREACGFYYQEFTSFKEWSLLDNPFGVTDDQNKVYTWAELIIPEKAKPIAFYDHKYFRNYPAVTINNYGKGTLLYEGCMVSSAIQEKIILDAMGRAGITTPDQDIQWPLITKSGKNDQGKTIRYYYNYSSEKAEFIFPYSGGTELITGKKVNAKEYLTIEPWDLIIIEE